jgi:hypothetical protein
MDIIVKQYENVVMIKAENIPKDIWEFKNEHFAYTKVNDKTYFFRFYPIHKHSMGEDFLEISNTEDDKNDAYMAHAFKSTTEANHYITAIAYLWRDFKKEYNNWLTKNI